MQAAGPLRSFGRRRGRPLHKSRAALMDTLLPQLLIPRIENSPSPAQAAPSLPSPHGGEGQGEGGLTLASLFPHPSRPLWFEIGFGGGEHLVEQARRNPEINFIGCEPYINGMATLLATIDQHKLQNIRLYDDDARALMLRLPDAGIERLFVLFPDPWPKARHHKRRIITGESLALFHRKLKANGLLRIATDHVDYSIWMLEQLLTSEHFTWTAQRSSDWQIPPEDWVTTRYQGKAAAEGRAAMFFDCRPR